jgi:membrane fusion protein (multidrug efflux system)
MASKAVYSAVAILGIATASGAAWWFQSQRPSQSAGQGDAQLVAAPPAQGVSASAAAGRPPTVEAAKVRLAAITDETQAVGSLRSRQGVMIRPEVGGRITRMNFNDGARVSKGQLLVQLDDQLQAAQVQQSQAELSIAQANHKRNQELVAQGFISQRSVDESAANLQVSQAKLALAQASAARLKIVAPFDGIAGIRTANVGDYLKDGADIVNLEDIDALYVDFRLPERYQSKVQPGQRASVDVDALPGRKFVAVVQAIDPLLDANGRSVAVRACIDNRQLQLRPGMFARVNAVFGERQDAQVVPEEALVPQGQRQFVMLLQPTPGDAQAWTTKRVEVKVGVRRPGQVEVVGELQPGDMVVTAGQQRVQRDGTLVRVVDVGGGAGSGNAGAAQSKPAVPKEEKAAAVPAAVKVLQRPAAAAGNNPCARDLAAARSAPSAHPALTSPGAA